MATWRGLCLVSSAWLVLGCGHDSGGENGNGDAGQDASLPADATVPDGIQIDRQITSPGADGCFQVDLGWSLIPEEGERVLTVQYTFRADRYSVEGLAERQIGISDASRFEVTENFEVCPTVAAQDTAFFDFEIVASGETSSYRSHPSIGFLVDAASWSADLEPQLVSLRAQIDAGDQSPELIRELNRTQAAYYHGGFAQFDARVDADVDAALAMFETPPTAGVSTAWRSLLKENGRVADVGFDLSTGRVTSVSLNETYRVPSRREADVVNFLRSAPITDLLPLDEGDTLRTRVTEDLPGGLLVQLYRYRDGVAVVPDMITVVVKRSGNEEYIAALEADLGDLGAASCEGADPGIEQEYGLSGEVYPDVSFLKALHRYDGIHYRCELRWVARYTDVDGNTWPWIRIVDAITGEVLQDGVVLEGDGTDATPHRVMVDQTVPYKSPPRWDTAYFTEPTSMAGGKILILQRGTPDASGFDRVVPCEVGCELELPDPPELPTFQPDDFLWIDSGLFSHDHADIGYLPWFGGHGEQYYFDPTYTHLPGYPTAFWFDSLNFGELARETPADPGVGGNTIHYSPAWRDDFDCDADAPHCGNYFHRGQGMAAGLHFYAQYARYIWTQEDANGVPVWSGGPAIDNNGRDLHFRSYLDLFTFDFCGRWDGFETIYFNTGGGDGPGDFSCDVFSTTNTPPHEFGHWVSNTQPTDVLPRSASFARSEAFADYIAASLRANWLMPSRLRNYSLVTNGDWQFKPNGDTEKYRGNVLYARLRSDHDYSDTNSHQYQNSFVWSGAWAQIMNVVGNYYSDRMVRSSYRNSSYHVGPQGKNHDSWCISEPCRRDAARSTTKHLYAWETAMDPSEHSTVDLDVFTNTRKREVQVATAQHDWLWKVSDKENRRQWHRTSMSPSHAMSVTMNDHRPARVHLRFDSEFDIQWVNFVAHAGVTYQLHGSGPLGGLLKLYRVAPANDHNGRPSSTLQGLARNRGCLSDSVSDSFGLPDIILTKTNRCDSQTPDGELMITFRPKVTGTYYASVYSPAGKGWLELRTKDGQRQITTTTLAKTSDFSRDTELRLGQSIPVSFPGTPEVRRGGVFRAVNEEHFWRFQYQPSRRMRDSSGGWSEFAGSWDTERDTTLAATLGGTYVISVTHNSSDASAVELHFYVADPSNPFSAPIEIGAPQVSQALPVAVAANGYRTDWTIKVKDLQDWASTSIGRLSPGQNVYLALKWSLIENHPQYAGISRGYTIRVESRHQPSNFGTLEDDSSTFNPIIVDRWCSVEQFDRQPKQLIERTGEMFSLNERLAPDDADYVVVWLSEGEHLNVTYRGGIPAALDIGGPMETTDGAGNVMTSASELNYIWKGSPDEWPSMTVAEKKSHVVYDEYNADSRFFQDYRPFLPDPNFSETCPSNYVSCSGQYFAERGFLWSYNSPGDTNKIAVSEDNETYLTMTAIVTGPYMIRVRGQGALSGTVDDWAQFENSGVGAAYTLNLNFGVIPNPPRPHWQFLDAESDPSRQLVCGR